MKQSDSFIPFKMAKIDTAYFLRWNLHFMSAFAMWPASYVVITLFSCFISFIVIAFWISHVAVAISLGNDMNKLPIAIGFVCGYFVSLYKWYTFFKHHGQIQEVFIIFSISLP